MLTRKLAGRGTALVAGLIAGLLSQAASATEEVVVYGDTVLEQIRAFDNEFQTRMDRNARDLDGLIRANVHREITRIKAPALRVVALSEAAKRG